MAQVAASELAFRRRVLVWYRRYGRHSLPWRKTRNPYRILVSEVMLQQTQVARVLVKYAEFMRAFPTIQALARASLSQVLAAWQGLGYNRRAKGLRDLAQTVVREHHGQLPHTVAELEALPGVGPYTARALACLAFGVPVAMVETNIRKVILHEFFPGRRKVAEREVQAMAERLLDRRHPRDWNLALMDYGAAHFTARRANPNRRSANYAVQSKFSGSQRFARGRIVALLTKQPRATQAAVTGYLEQHNISRAKAAAALTSLVADGLVELWAGQYCLAK